jgi:hypothetical protein
LPKKAVEQIVGGDKRNTARAIRTLLERGIVQRSKDGKRLRPPGATPPGSRMPFFSFWVCAPDILEEPLDDEKAEAVLEAFGESWEGVA